MLCLVCLTGAWWTQWGPAIEVPFISWLWPSSKPAKVFVVRESSDAIKLTVPQLAWINSPKLAADCKVAGIELHVIDPDVKDRDGKMPTELAPVIERATKAGLPRMIFVGSSGRLTDFALPSDDASARAQIGIGGTP
ncbi:hypothetical protein M0R72_10115 [Candidatus Pacearchaeota archaeon]|nr:hypothetical protein [Candidatus Pacearchaeota archaeon]